MKTVFSLAKTQTAETIKKANNQLEELKWGVHGNEAGLLIGHHGKTLESLQLILGILISKRLGEWVKAYVNVGDYREKREEALMHMAQRAADRALALGRPVELSRLSPSERRIIHLTLSGDDRVETESMGEGDARVLLVKPKAEAV